MTVSPPSNESRFFTFDLDQQEVTLTNMTPGYTYKISILNSMFAPVLANTTSKIIGDFTTSEGKSQHLVFWNSLLTNDLGKPVSNDFRSLLVIGYLVLERSSKLMPLVQSHVVVIKPSKGVRIFDLSHIHDS